MKNVILAFALTALFAVTSAPAFTASSDLLPAQDEGAVALTGCTPKREAALADQAARKAKCATENLDRAPEQMLIDCAVPKDAKDIQDLIDIFVGAQQAGLNAGASLPHAQPGLRPMPRDGGK